MSKKNNITRKITVPEGSENKPASVHGAVKSQTNNGVTLIPFGREQEVFFIYKRTDQ